MEEVSLAAGIVIALRLIIPLSIFKWNIGGAFAAMIADALDVVLVDFLAASFNEPSGFGANYQFLDKWLDMYYLSFEAAVSWKWTNKLARNTSIALFAYRLIGLIIFEVTGIRKLFFFFPNLFENFYLYYAIARRFAPKLSPRTGWQLLLILFILYIPKFAQEWTLHYAQLQPWQWLKSAIGLHF